MTVQSNMARNQSIQKERVPAQTFFTLPFSNREVRQRRVLQAALVAGDGIALLISFGLAYWLRFYAGIGVEHDVVPDPTAYLPLIFLLIPVWIGIFAFMRCYDYSHLLGGTAEYVGIANGCTWGMMFVIIYAFLDVEFSIARGWLVLSWVLSVLVLCTWRLLMRRIAYKARRQGMFVSPSIIVGTNQEAYALATQLNDTVASGIQMLGFVRTDRTSTIDTDIDTGNESETSRLPILGCVADLPEIVQRTGAEDIIVASTSMSRDELFLLTSALSGTTNTKLHFSSGLYEVLTTGMEVTTRASVPLLNMNRLRLSRAESIMKTMLDYSLILLALPFLLPLFIALAIAVRIDSPGPVFYRRQVLGVGGKPFDGFKFRSMYVNGDQILNEHPELRAELQRNHKLKNDPRITRMGNFMRRYSLDELPQLLNVLLGQMSLVGPRMISPVEHNLYGRMRHNLLTVKPGLTGMWQVSGRSDLAYEERVHLDMYYIRNYSIWLDVQILFFQTIPAVFKGRGAY